MDQAGRSGRTRGRGRQSYGEPGRSGLGRTLRQGGYADVRGDFRVRIEVWIGVGIAIKLCSLFAAAALLIGAAACTPAANKLAEKSAEASCPDDGHRLPGTGLCQGRVANYFDPARLAGVEGDLPAGCTYVINETMTIDPEEAILYNALSCKGKTTKLEFSAGARSASLSWGVSSFFENVPTAGAEGSERVRIFSLLDIADPKAMILVMAKATAKEEKAPAAEIAACEVRQAGENYPADAFMVDVNDAYKKANKLGTYDKGLKDDPSTGVYCACGPYGVTDAPRFWMIRDGYAWFVDQGQDLPDFDATSLTVFRKGADGAWAPVS